MIAVRREAREVVQPTPQHRALPLIGPTHALVTRDQDSAMRSQMLTENASVEDARIRSAARIDRMFSRGIATRSSYAVSQVKVPEKQLSAGTTRCMRSL